MKLYTEEQVRQMLEVCRDSDLYEHILTFEDILKTETPIELPSDMLCVNCDESKPTHNICMDCIIKVGKQNIELPSDEEIEQYVKSTGYYGHCTQEYHEGIEEGARWMRDKIQGGNK